MPRPGATWRRRCCSSPISCSRPSISASSHAVVGNYDRADAFFAEAVEIDPNDLGTRTSWAEVLEKQGRVREAAFQWVAAVEIDRDDPVLRQDLAETYLILGMLDEARTQIDQAIALDPIHAMKYQDRSICRS